MRPPKTPLSTLKVDKNPVYTLDQLYEFARAYVAYEREAIETICAEVMSRCEGRDNTMGYIIAEEISSKIVERTTNDD